MKKTIYTGIFLFLSTTLSLHAESRIKTHNIQKIERSVEQRFVSENIDINLSDDAKQLLDKAFEYYDAKKYPEAVNIYTKAYNLDKLAFDSYDYMFYATSYKAINEIDDAIFIYGLAIDSFYKNEVVYVKEYGRQEWVNTLSIAYIAQMELNLDKGNNDLVIEDGDDILAICQKYSIVKNRHEIYALMAYAYTNKKYTDDAIDVLDLSLKYYLEDNYPNMTLRDLELKETKDESIGVILYLMSLNYKSMNDQPRYLAYLQKAVVFGDNNAEKELEKFDTSSDIQVEQPLTVKQEAPKAQTNNNYNFKKYKAGDMNFSIPNYTEWAVENTVEDPVSMFMATKTKGAEAMFIVITGNESVSPDTLSDLLFHLLKKQMDNIYVGDKTKGIMDGTSRSLQSKNDENVIGSIDAFTKYGKSYIIMYAFDKSVDTDKIQAIYDSLSF